MIILRLQRPAAPVRVSIGVNFLIPITFPKDDQAGIAEEDLIAGMDGFVEKVTSAEEKHRNEINNCAITPNREFAEHHKPYAYFAGNSAKYMTCNAYGVLAENHPVLPSPNN